MGPYIYTVDYGYHLGLIVGYRDPSIGDHIQVSGISSGWHGGTVLLTNVKIVDGPPFPILYNQVIVDYSILPGDSGSPAFYCYGPELLPGLAFVKIGGINKGVITGGNYQGCTVVSSQSGIYYDIHARPLII